MSSRRAAGPKWRRLALLAGVSECFVYAEAKYCAFEVHGEPKYYVCPKTEYCCNFGCCVSPGFQMYHLWYYWLLVIIMFLVCSGGGWWYRYWFHGRHRTTASAIPHRTTNTRASFPIGNSTCRRNRAIMSYNTARNTVLLHRMWKAPGAHRGVMPSAYSGAAGPASSAGQHYQNTSVVLNDVNCPYYQLYGPPPSYETVIAQSRGKSSPSSPELLRPGQSRAGGPPPTPEGYPPLGPCFYRPLEAPQYQATAGPAACAPGGARSLVDAFEAEYVRLVQQQYGAVLAGPTIVASPRHAVHPMPLGPGQAASDNSNEAATNCSQVDSPDDGGFGLAARNECLGSTCGLDRPLPCYASAGKMHCRVGVHGMSRRGDERGKFEAASSSSQSELPIGEPIATTSLGFEGCPSAASGFRMVRRCSKVPRSWVQGGSLKIPRSREARLQQQHDAERRLSGADYRLQQLDKPEAHPIPSSNVIAPVAQAAAEPDLPQRPRGHSQSQQQQQQQQCPPASLTAERSSTNSNVESKRKKLDRSKSLD